MSKREFNITDAARGAAITVKIIPKANKTEIVGIQDDGTVKIRLMSPPVEGQANEELIRYLAEFLSVRPSDVEIVAGADSRKKLISVMHIQVEELEALIRAQVGSAPSEDDD